MIAENWGSYCAAPRIKILGLGGGGGNAVDYMLDAGPPGVEFIFADADHQRVRNSRADTKICLAREVQDRPFPGTSAMHDEQKIADAVDGADLLIIVVGLGGYTGSSALPVVASLTKELTTLTIAVVTTPFCIESPQRQRCAARGIDEALSELDLLIPLPCSELFLKVRGDTTLLEAFRRANEAMLTTVRGLVLPFANSGLAQFDFSDLRWATHDMGLGAIGTGVSRGENRVVEAAAEVFAEFGRQGVDTSSALRLFVDIAAGVGLESGHGDPVSLGECQYAVELVSQATGIERTAVSTAVDPQLDGNMRLTVIATGLDAVAGGRPIAPADMPIWIRRQAN